MTSANDVIKNWPSESVGTTVMIGEEAALTTINAKDLPGVPSALVTNRRCR